MLKDTFSYIAFCLNECIAHANQKEQYYRDGQKDECKFTLPNMYLCFRSSVMDEEKRGNATRCAQ